MPSMLSRVAAFARSPQGRRAMAQAQRIARDPATRQKIADARRQLAARGSKRP